MLVSKCTTRINHPTALLITSVYTLLNADDDQCHSAFLNRHPAPSTRPTFKDILAALLHDEAKVLDIPVEDASTHEQASLLGAPLEAGENMYSDLQQLYLPDITATSNNSDYVYVWLCRASLILRPEHPGNGATVELYYSITTYDLCTFQFYWISWFTVSYPHPSLV